MRCPAAARARPGRPVRRAVPRHGRRPRRPRGGRGGGSGRSGGIRPGNRPGPGRRCVRTSR
ncbi:hypothetical protein CRI70_29470 [Streptomyces sp. Ru87]|nr:hypothetical protein CRI70_29470 [Streptomyces sp. Ru87]